MEGDQSGKSSQGHNLKRNKSNNHVTESIDDEEVPKSSDISESLFQRDGVSDVTRVKSKAFSINDRDTIVDEVEEIK